MLGCNPKAGQAVCVSCHSEAHSPLPRRDDNHTGQGEDKKTRAETSVGRSWAGELGRLHYFLSRAFRELRLGRSHILGLWCWHQ